jgi:hypothetical protein
MLESAPDSTEVTSLGQLIESDGLKVQIILERPPRRP